MSDEFKIELMVSVVMILGGILDAMFFAVLADKYRSDKYSILAGIGAGIMFLGFACLILCLIWRML